MDIILQPATEADEKALEKAVRPHRIDWESLLRKVPCTGTWFRLCRWNNNSSASGYAISLRKQYSMFEFKPRIFDNKTDNTYCVLFCRTTVGLPRV